MSVKEVIVSQKTTKEMTSTMKGTFEVATPKYMEREDVSGNCLACGAVALAKYPVCTEGGWFNVVKCQECLHTVSRERGPLLGPINLLINVMKGGAA